jgi:hypothetical protein
MDSFSEVDLEGVWAVDPILGTRLAAFIRHYVKHKDAVDAQDEAQYLRKAIAFAQECRGHGQDVAGLTPGVRRWRKQGRYIDITLGGEIVSFGATE